MASLKRKRAPSAALSPWSGSRGSSQLPAESINPLSHPPLLLKQFALAGYPDTQHRPSELYPGFPHRPLPQDRAFFRGDNAASEPDEDQEEPSREKKETWERTRIATEKRNRRYEQHLGGLIGIIQRGLAGGDIPRAKRAFGLLMRREIRGKQVDLRHNGLWAIGAEILVREGETPEDVLTAVGERRKRVPTPANMATVRNYYEALIQHFPYNRLHKDSASALQFYPALFAAEMDYVYMSQKQGLDEVENPSWGSGEVGMDVDQASWGYADVDRPRPSYEDLYQPRYRDDGHDSVDGDIKTNLSGNLSQASLLRDRAERDRLRLQALERMRDIADRMAGAMEQAPFSIDPELLRLRAMVTLYLGDLSLPPAPRSLEEDYWGKQERTKYRIAARKIFSSIMKQGVEIEEKWIRDFVDEGLVEASDEEDQVEEDTPARGYDPYRL